MEDKKNQKISLGEFILYAGSRDERVRAAADKGGHISFQFLMILSLLDVLGRGVLLQTPHEHMWFTYVVFFGGALFYSVQWALRGVTYLDTKRQRVLYRKVILGASVFTAIFCAVLIYFNLSRFGEWDTAPFWIWGLPPVAGVLTAGLSFLLVRLLHNLAKAQADKLVDKET